MLASMTYKEARATLIAHARDLLGHDRVQHICNAMVKQYFCGQTSQWGQPADLLYTLHHQHEKRPTTGWSPGSRPAIGAPGINDSELLQIVSMQAGLFKHDLALRGFDLKILINGQNFSLPAIGWEISPL